MTSPGLADRRVALLGNVGPGSPDYSTENEWLRAYQHHEMEVTPFCERDVSEWESLIELVGSSDRPDFVQWTSTPHWRLQLPREIQTALLDAGEANGVPIVGIHLDRFWSIPVREQWIRSHDPFFFCHILFTADGGNQEKWDRAGANHRWLLPGVGERWCHRGTVREKYRSEVAFVGSWFRYHDESRHRRELINFLQRNYKSLKLWPGRKQHAIRGDELTDLYWSTDLAVGDSFFASRGQHKPPPNYSSDRITESLGRGAMLLHPNVSGVTDGPFDVPNLSTWEAWRWKELKRAIDEQLSMTQAVRTRKRNAGIKFMKEHHTYEKRVEQVIAILETEGLL
jgi:hypothetical protein